MDLRLLALNLPQNAKTAKTATMGSEKTVEGGQGNKRVQHRTDTHGCCQIRGAYIALIPDTKHNSTNAINLASHGLAEDKGRRSGTRQRIKEVRKDFLPRNANRSIAERQLWLRRQVRRWRRPIGATDTNSRTTTLRDHSRWRWHARLQRGKEQRLEKMEEQERGNREGTKQHVWLLRPVARPRRVGGARLAAAPEAPAAGRACSGDESRSPRGGKASLAVSQAGHWTAE
jgi:hypothetical protein